MSYNLRPVLSNPPERGMNWSIEFTPAKFLRKEKVEAR